MAAHEIVEGVRSIRSAVHDISTFCREGDLRALLVAKSVLRGSDDFARRASDYERNTVYATREEAVCVERALRYAARNISHGMPAKDAAVIMLSRNNLDKIIDAVVHDDSALCRSTALKQFSDYLNGHRSDYRAALLTIGESVIDRMSRNANPWSVSPVTVDLARLDGPLPVQVKVVYREFKRIEEIARGLSPR